MVDLGLDHDFSQGAPESVSMDSMEQWTLNGLITETTDEAFEQYDDERWKTLPRQGNPKK